MDIQTLRRGGLDEFKIRELYLYKVPSLKTCDNWTAVKEIGWIEFKGKHATYEGALVQYGENVYFISHARIEALAPYRKWSLKQKIEVIPEKKK
ncbi:MAG: hypothetical protein ABUK01_01360 [Leptospirales bacterium]